MADTISITSRLPLGVGVANGLTIMPGTTNVNGAAWESYAATKPDLIANGDIVEANPAPVPASDGKGDAPLPPTDVKPAPAQPAAASVAKAQPATPALAAK